MTENTPPIPSWEEYLESSMEMAKKFQAQCELMEANPGMNAVVGFAWLKVAADHLVKSYEIMQNLQQRTQYTYDFVQLFLSADRSVPREELEARAELLGLFVQALRQRTQGASP